MKGAIRSEKGVALVITLLMLAVITALVTEFASGVYTTTQSLYIWRDSQRLSLVSRSGVTLVGAVLSEMEKVFSYTYPAMIELPVEGMLDGYEGSVFVRAEDEQARLNLNALRNADALKAFRGLLARLRLEESIADRVLDWIDQDSEPRLLDSESDAKNASLDSVEELLWIRGIDGAAYELLAPYVTVFGGTGVNVNINTAPLPVIMSLGVAQEDAGLILRERQKTPFVSTADFIRRAGDRIGTPLLGKITVKSSLFRVTAAAEERKVRRSIEAVLEVHGGSPPLVRHWREW